MEERDDLMPSSAETIEALARKLERTRILLDLKDAKPWMISGKSRKNTKPFATMINNNIQ